MLWLQPLPWARWVAAGALVVVAAWMELKPEAMVDHPFATVTIEPGQRVDATNTVSRRVPVGLLPEVDAGGVARHGIELGEPLLPSSLTTDELAPAGWWSLSLEVPSGAAVGDEVLLVLIDTGATVPGVVTSTASQDPFATVSGAVAVPEEHAAAVAMASAEARVVVLVSQG